MNTNQQRCTFRDNRVSALFKNIHFQYAWETPMWWWQDWTSHSSPMYIHNVVKSVQNQQFVKAPRRICGNSNAASTACCESRRKCLNGSIETYCNIFGTYLSEFLHIDMHKNNATVQLIIHVKCDHAHEVRCEAHWKWTFLNKTLTRLARDAPC